LVENKKAAALIPPDGGRLVDKARRGEVPNFTGVYDPREPPRRPEIRLETLGHTAEENARA
jgi:adenylylsulfate kinase-like enzyme